MKKLLFLALGAIPALAAAQATNGRDYVRMAGASDQYEIQSSQLILTTSRNPALRRFASQMIHDHSMSTAEVKRAAMQGRVMAGPPHLDPMGMRNIAELRRARGPARDALYIQQQKQAHQMALQLQQSYAAHGDVRPLARAASMIAPVVQHHLSELQHM